MSSVSSESADAGDPRGCNDQERPNRALLSAVLTLTLSILGRKFPNPEALQFIRSSVLPVPYAFSRLGVLCGLLTQLVVATCNATASVLLLDVASYVGNSSYEGVAEAVGGRGWKVLTQIPDAIAAGSLGKEICNLQVSLLALLFGTIVGDFALLGDVGKQAIKSLVKELPSWLDGDGRVLMVLLAVGILPICCLRRMRSLEIAGTAGLSVIVAVMAIIIYQSIAAGLPAIADGELPLWGVRVSRDLPEAMSVMGFAFYVAPMLLPLRAELPRGPAGDRQARRAAVLVTAGLAQAVYGALGVFGAARHGLGTAGNVLANRWLADTPQGILDIVIALYLGISIPPISLSLRCTLECLVAGEGAAYSATRHYLTTIVPLAAALGIALSCPQASEKIFAVTGATAVMLVCYLIPVCLHLMLRSQRWDAAGREALLGDEGSRERPRREKSRMKEVATEIVVPVIVALVGVGCSVAALAVSIASLVHPSRR